MPVQNCASRVIEELDCVCRCPLCRRVLYTGRNLPVTVVLQNVLRHAFPQESASRERELQACCSGGSSDEGTDLPIFVMAPLLPTEKISLNIFEPRYRLMVRRCMEGNKRMGMTCAVTVCYAASLRSSMRTCAMLGRSTSSPNVLFLCFSKQLCCTIFLSGYTW